MLKSEEQWLAVTDAFHNAALDGDGWDGALEGLARATGSQGGQLICLGENAAIPINIMTGIDPAFHEDFVACGGGDPQINPRVGAGMQAPVLQVLAESDFITPEEYSRHPHYQGFACRWDVPFICLTVLERRNDLLVGLAAVRSHRQGHINSTERAVFASIAPHVRAAVRSRMAFEDGGAAIVSGTLDALGIAAFVCDRAGVVRALTPAAEALVRSERGLQLRLGRLQALDPAQARALNDAIGAAAVGQTRPGPPLHRTLVVRAEPGDLSPLVLDVIALPRRAYEFGFAPRVLVVARGRKTSDAQMIAVLRTTYDLTAAEAEVALQLCMGQSPATIAAARAVAVGTVRLQIKAVMAKVGVSRQAELVARLKQF